MSAVGDVRDEFREAVDMTPKELEDWLDTEESQAVGQKSGGTGESTGHESGRRIVALLRTGQGELTDDELEHARWTASLKNWGHDPLE